MAIDVADIKFYRSAVVTDTPTNGGVIDLSSQVVDNVKYNLFPRVSHAERMNGVTRYRKLFMANRNNLDEKAYGAFFGLLSQSNGGDRFYLTSSVSPADTQQNIIAQSPKWYGAGVLAAGVSAGATSMQVNMEANDYHFDGGQLLYISDSNNDAWVTTIGGEYYTETVGTGDGINYIYSYTVAHHPVDLASVAITYTIGGVIYDAVVDSDGSITGDYIDSGHINEQTGVIDIHYNASHPPDNGTDITIDYMQRCYQYIGNVATVQLATQIPQSFAANTTKVAACVPLYDLYPELYGLTKTSANGNIDGQHIVLHNIGTVFDNWTLTFVSSTEYQCVGQITGALPNGLTTSTYSPANPRDGGAPYFSIPTAAWSGVWQTGNTVQFSTRPAYAAVWLKEVVPPGTDREPNNVVQIVWFIE